MITNSRSKLQLLHFLLIVTVFFSMWDSHAGTARGVPALTSSAIQVAPQEKVWNVGDRVEVQWKGDWYQANVNEVKGNQYKIHYEGYDSSWDEWVDSSRIRASGIKPNNSNTSQTATTNSPFNQVLALLRQSYEKQAAGQTDAAISLAQSALQSAEKDLGPEHGTVAMSLAALAQLYDQKPWPLQRNPVQVSNLSLSLLCSTASATSTTCKAITCVPCRNTSALWTYRKRRWDRTTLNWRQPSQIWE